MDVASGGDSKHHRNASYSWSKYIEIEYAHMHMHDRYFAKTPFYRRHLLQQTHETIKYVSIPQLYDIFRFEIVVILYGISTKTGSSNSVVKNLLKDFETTLQETTTKFNEMSQ